MCVSANYALYQGDMQQSFTFHLCLAKWCQTSKRVFWSIYCIVDVIQSMSVSFIKFILVLKVSLLLVSFRRSSLSVLHCITDQYYYVLRFCILVRVSASNTS